MTKRQLALEILSLSSPRGRLLAFSLATVAIYFSHYHWLDHLSIWGHLGIPSPSIGLTRAYWLLIHGHPVASWHRNPLIYLVLAVGIPLLLMDMLWLTNDRHRAKLPTSMV
ncbi:DUF2752 domain-containing protein [Aeromicrobium sp.]|nr:DUF2752 domain-containing protein [Candidatus Saccharibacteria bacterium]